MKWVKDIREYHCLVVEGEDKGTLAVKVVTTEEERNSDEAVIPFDPVKDQWRFKVLEEKDVKGRNRKRQK